MNSSITEISCRPREGAPETDTNRLISYFSISVIWGGWHLEGGTRFQVSNCCCEVVTTSGNTEVTPTFWENLRVCEFGNLAYSQMLRICESVNLRIWEPGSLKNLRVCESTKCSQMFTLFRRAALFTLPQFLLFHLFLCPTVVGSLSKSLVVNIAEVTPMLVNDEFIMVTPMLVKKQPTPGLHKKKNAKNNNNKEMQKKKKTTKVKAYRFCALSGRFFFQDSKFSN